MPVQSSQELPWNSVIALGWCRGPSETKAEHRNPPKPALGAGQLLPAALGPAGVRGGTGGDPSDRQVLAGCETQSPRQQPRVPGPDLAVTLGPARLWHAPADPAATGHCPTGVKQRGNGCSLQRNQL